MNRWILAAGILSACSSQRHGAVDDAGGSVPSVPPPVSEAQPPRPRGDSAELEPGSLRAFGVLLPAGSQERFADDTTKMFTVSSNMPRVMRYLQRRLDILNADIHPLGAMIHNAHVRATSEGDQRFVDVGLRDEGDHTLVTVWNRSQAALPPRSPEEGMRAAGFDPVTGRPLPANNR